MKNIHSETDSERLHRTEQLLMSVANQEQYISHPIKSVSFDCTECGILLKNMEDIKLHNKTYHGNGDVKVEPGKGSFDCDKLEGVFQNKYLLVQHRLAVHKN